LVPKKNETEKPFFFFFKKERETAMGCCGSAAREEQDTVGAPHLPVTQTDEKQSLLKKEANVRDVCGACATPYPVTTKFCSNCGLKRHTTRGEVEREEVSVVVWMLS